MAKGTSDRRGDRKWRAQVRQGTPRIEPPRLDAYRSVFLPPSEGVANYSSHLDRLDSISQLLANGSSYAKQLPAAAFEFHPNESTEPRLLDAEAAPPEAGEVPALERLPKKQAPPLRRDFESEVTWLDKILYWRAVKKISLAKANYGQAHRRWLEEQTAWNEANERNERRLADAAVASERAAARKAKWSQTMLPVLNQFEKARDAFAKHLEQVEFLRLADERQLLGIKQQYETSDPSSYFAQIIRRSPYPDFIKLSPRCRYVDTAQALIIDIDLVDFGPEIDRAVESRKRWRTGPSRSVPTKGERAKLREDAALSLLIRTVHEIAKSDVAMRTRIIAVNGHLTWDDPATGQQRCEIVASLQCQTDAARNLALEKLNPKECFRSFSGANSPGLATGMPSPVLPMLAIQDDGRIVEGRSILKEGAGQKDLLDLTWEDFEHLVRELFAKEFASTSARVDVTRASRDWGVDALIQDPDPIRGGKFVIQAKHYRKVVGVDAVRDLYGTVVNEGANRGILVTTSHYGPQSYEFSKNKPITLIDGAALIALLRKHGYFYLISPTS
jgi:restriction system protein